jgi:hypothetical protein
VTRRIAVEGRRRLDARRGTVAARPAAMIGRALVLMPGLGTAKIPPATKQVPHATSGRVLQLANLGSARLARRSIGCVRTEELPQWSRRKPIVRATADWPHSSRFLVAKTIAPRESAGGRKRSCGPRQRDSAIPDSGPEDLGLKPVAVAAEVQRPDRLAGLADQVSLYGNVPIKAIMGTLGLCHLGLRCAV